MQCRISEIGSRYEGMHSGYYSPALLLVSMQALQRSTTRATSVSHMATLGSASAVQSSPNTLFLCDVSHLDASSSMSESGS